MRRTNLPVERTSFVGRSRELAAIRELFDDGAQLVTVTGMAGVGKTRLARRFAAVAMGHLGGAGGAWFCDLSDARSAGEVAAVAGTLDAVAGGDPVGEIGHALAGRGEVLVVLDNCEQVVSEVAAALERWMDAAPEATFVATSRERLRVGGERLVELDPLAVPEPGAADLAPSDAASLFVERARAVRPGWQPDAGETAAVAALVHRLDGLPLAIELAAARMRMLGVEQLADLVARRFELLVGGPRGAAARQATLRGALDWSWELLDAAEQAALAQCSVFRGGFSLEGAEHVLALPARTGAPSGVLDVLAALHDKSLVRAETEEEPRGTRRYRLFESIRDYADERLTGPARSAAFARHAAYYTSLADTAPTSARAGAADVAAARRLLRELDNLMAVVQRLDADGVQPQHALEALVALGPIVAARGPLAEHETALGVALAAGTRMRVSAPLLARARAARAVVRRSQGRLADALVDLEAGLALAGDDPLLEGALLHHVGVTEMQRGSYDAAFAAYGRALQLLEPAGDERGVGHVLGDLAGIHLVLGQLDDARGLLERCLALLRAVGDPRGVAEAVGTLGVVLLQMRRVAEGAAAIAQAIDLFREIGDRRNLGIAQGNLGIALQEQRRFDEAAEALDASIANLRELGARRVAGVYLGYRGVLYHEIGRLDDACEEYEAAIAALRACGDRRRLGQFLGYLGGILARLGRRERARAHFDEADVLLADDARLGAAVGVHRLELEPERDAVLARARELADGSHQIRFSLRVHDAWRRPSAAPPPATAIEGLEGGEGTEGRALVLARDGRWFALGRGPRVDLSRRGALRRLLLHLGHLRLSTPDVALTLEGMVAAGWPGERMLAESGADRVYTTVQRLRRLGLEGVLVTRDDGYLLDPRLPFDWAEPE